MQINSKNGFVVHYYLQGEDHSIDSLTLHESQEQLFFLIKEVAAVFGVDVRIKVTPSEEGGFVHILKFIGDNAAALTIVSTIISGLLVGAVWLTHQRPLINQQQEINEQQKKINDQQIAKNALEIEKTRIEVERLKKEGQEASATSSGQIPNENNLLLNLEPLPDSDEIVKALMDNKKIVKRISNFYEIIANNDDVVAIGYRPSAVKEESLVLKESFEKYIFKQILIEDLLINGAVIEITSPVLNDKNLRWHGVFDKENIRFSVSDAAFEENVLKKRIIFRNGSKISCSLRMHRRINSVGDVEIYDRIAENIVFQE
ncbi:hypothetical protein [Acidovorax sp. SUPP2825]|uniref:hypothetical protein n=1 Tax=Acidovorax sp. SUPP2825 TaxID=2920879 RepID=UPI0023DE4A7F|nr:hypothetical protein [Acidovorax sp. SUPP2825]GKS96610.1 hypothetical protein AVAK2825_18765 [Acidovorax sp. SUPP2825]